MEEESPVGSKTEHALKVLKREGYDRGRGPARSLSESQIQTLIDSTATSRSAWSTRDTALIAACYYGTLRVSEALNLDREHVKFLPTGEADLVIAKSKTDQTGRGSTITLPEEGTRHLHRWIEFAGIESGPVFRGIQNIWDAQFKIKPTRLGYPAALLIIKTRAKRSGLGKITTHSLRRSHTRNLAERGATLIELQRLGRWTDPSMPAHYSNHTGGQSSVVRKFYGTPKLKKIV